MLSRPTATRSTTRTFGFAVACLLSLSVLSPSETIGNLSYWSNRGVADGYGGTDLAIGAWNGPMSPIGYAVPAGTVGEVITAPTNGKTVLQSFTAVMPGSPPSFRINMTAAVFAWDQTDFHPVGSALGSALVRTPAMAGTAPYLNNFYNLTFAPDAPLSPGRQYVVLFSTLGLSQPVFYESTSFGVTATNSYTGGEMVFASTGALHESSTSLIATESGRWGEAGSCDQWGLSTLCWGPSEDYFQYPGIVAPDLAFSADFEPSADTTTPEPCSCFLLGIICIGCARCRAERSGAKVKSCFGGRALSESKPFAPFP